MTDIVLFHHAQGLTDGVRELAGRLEAADHTVTVPDLYETRTFATVQEGVAHAQAIGFDTVMGRAAAAVEDLPLEVVYVGLSLGVLPAQMLTQTRPGALGAVLCASCVPTTEFSTPWPAGVPLQVHGKERDPIFADEGDLAVARELVEELEDAELFLYPGDEHLFFDASLPEAYDGEAALLMERRILDLLDRVG